MERKREKNSKRPAGSWSIYTIAKTAAGASVSETHKRDMIGWRTAGGHYSLLGSVSVCLEGKGNDKGCSRLEGWHYTLYISMASGRPHILGDLPCRAEMHKQAV